MEENWDSCEVLHSFLSHLASAPCHTWAFRFCGARASNLAYCSQGMIYCLVHANTQNEPYYHSQYDCFDYSVYRGWEWVIKIIFKCRFYLHRYQKISLSSKAFCYCSLHPGETSHAWSFPLAPQLWGNHIFLLAPLAFQAMQRAGSTWDLNDNSLPGGK